MIWILDIDAVAGGRQFAPAVIAPEVKHLNAGGVIGFGIRLDINQRRPAGKPLSPGLLIAIADNDDVFGVDHGLSCRRRANEMVVP